MTVADHFLGSGLVARAADWGAGGGLRVLAYHGIPDPEQFRRQMCLLAKRYVPVTLDDVERAYSDGVRLPDHAAWVTFDDGHPDVVDVGRKILGQLGIRATMFVCPGVLNTDDPYWWQLVEEALARNLPVMVHGRIWRDAAVITYLKSLPDDERRHVVEGVKGQLVTVTGRMPARGQLTTDDLWSWVSDGHSVGNHTWDHPCLDRCSEETQTAQITKAHDWLAAELSSPPIAFAYPNGNWTAHGEETLRALGYRLGLLFDHRLARPSTPSLRVSRLRVDTHAGLHRLRSIVSGAHPVAFSLRKRLSSSISA